MGRRVSTRPQSFFTSRREKFATACRALNKTNRLHLAVILPYRESQRETRLNLRMYRESTPDAIVFALSGDMGQEHAVRPHALLADAAYGRLQVDLQDVTLDDRAAMQILADDESAGIRVGNGPVDVRSGIVAEKESEAEGWRPWRIISGGRTRRV